MVNKRTSNKNIQKLLKYELKRENKVQHQPTDKISKKHSRKAQANK
jgi:hypothetical protein